MPHFFDREQGHKIAIAGGPWAPRDIERRANAFGAMFLMPRDLVKKALAELTVGLESKDGVGQVAHRLGTSFLGTLRHLTNLGFLDEYMQQSIFEVTLKDSVVES